jgi:hypothetical protein
VDAVFLLDCEEETLSEQLLKRAKDDKRIHDNVNTVAKRINAFKEKTLPVLKHYDDQEKLFIVSVRFWTFSDLKHTRSRAHAHTHTHTHTHTHIFFLSLFSGCQAQVCIL